jgi:hypothetical protein
MIGDLFFEIQIEEQIEIGYKVIRDGRDKT